MTDEPEAVRLALEIVEHHAKHGATDAASLKLARQCLAYHEVVKAAREYALECVGPVPDAVLRRALHAKLFAAISNLDKAGG